ncbi:MAG: PAS domain S-box protein [bacterium]|nr:PAS domain S-box protein [bacterium]
MTHSIVFKIDQQQVIQERTTKLDALVNGLDETATLSLSHFFSPNDEKDLQHALQKHSASSTLVPGFLAHLPEKPKADLYFHCLSSEDKEPLFECILICADGPTTDTPPEISSSLFKHNPLPFYCFDTNGTFIHVNEKLIEFTGIDEELLLTLGYKDFVHPNDLAQTDEYFKQALNGTSNQYELSVVIKDGIEKRIRVNKFPRFEDGAVTGVYGIFEDITDKTESEARWRELVEQSPLPVLVFVDAKFVFTNSAAPPFYELDSKDDLIGRSVYEFIPDDEVEFLKKRQKQLENNEQPEPGESRIITKSGEIRHIVAHSRPIIYQGKRAIQSVIFDITELKKQQEIIEQSLKEKETLLKEIHHRVKNNLAIISGLLELQIKKVDDPLTVDILKNSQNRILSIALVHQKLYQVDTLDEVNVGDYVEELISNLQNTLQHSGNLSINVAADDVLLNIEHAVPCSLIINEAVVNAIKHGFADKDQGNINITIKRNPSMVQIKVEDNGCGIPDDFEFEQADSLGLTLIRILSQQLEGNCRFEALETEGTRFILRFPLPAH